MMVSIPCDQAVHCFPCADEASNPLANLSTEEPDTNLFLSVVFRRVPNPPHNNWNQDSCVGVCESAISQEDANDCAARAALECVINTQPAPNPDNPSWTPLFCNTEQNCQNGSDCYTQPACSVDAFSVAEANTIAKSLCDYRVHNHEITSSCGGSPEPPLEPPVSSCPVESGSSAPITLEIVSERNWEIFEVVPGALTAFLSSGACNPTDRFTYVWPNRMDHPPGEYQVEYVSGFFVNSPNNCDPGEVDVQMTVYQLWDDEHNFDNPTACGPAGVLANVFRQVEPGPPSGNFGSGFQGCFPTFADAQSFISGLFNAPGAKKRLAWNYLGDRNHSNTGGDFMYVIYDAFLQSGVPALDLLTQAGYEFRLKIVQINGLIPQPRKLAIVDYALLITQFSDPTVAAAWDGELNTRAAYTDTELRWTDPAVGSFGGAVLSWTNAHPASANGFGWKLEIFSAGAVLMYRAFKAVGSASEGYYYRHSSTPIGPECVQCLDNSDIPWEPAE